MIQTMPFKPFASVKAPIYQARSQFKGISRHLTRISAIAGLLAFGWPSAPATAFFYGYSDSEVGVGDYSRCASALTGAKISSEAAASACARALKPDDLGKCVQRVTQRDAELTADVTLSACREVRRPVDMADCVVDIRTKFGDAPALAVLDNCRRSLLPKRYADCVVGINRPTNLAAEPLMTTCIDASDYPRELDPTFIRYTTDTTTTTPGLPSTAPLSVPPANPAAPASPAAPTTSTPPANPAAPGSSPTP